MKKYLTVLLGKAPLFLLGLLVISCKQIQLEEKKVARAGNFYLYESEIASLQTKGLPVEDSTKLVDAFINNWLVEHAFLEKAMVNLSDDDVESIDKQVKDYRASLLNFYYENALLDKELDTVVSSGEVQTVYDSSDEQYELKFPIYRLAYIEIENKKNKKDSVKLWLKELDENANDANLRQFCSFEALNCHLSIDDWVGEDKLTETLVFKSGKSLSELSLNRVYSLEGTNSNNYWIKLYRVQSSGKAPLSYVKTDIEKRIIRQRKNAFLQRIKEDIYKSALANNEIEVYD